ncbi:MAG: translation initiation factor IF-2 [Phycisphaerae bacterium]|nr:MAG: translation initiation factor IF-2 [Planctomycetia bacterium]RIK70581.1 MAG: translation initiation factor IF-2 [Planctomycetota bacterium]GJQ26262.1 MAG: translation initiation factor IF-2 [Phycisphaerae bacterium]
MAEKKLRIHNLSKELSVSNQAIIDKCRAEGIDVKNHMHVLSAGLAATIREWFSDSAQHTALEEAKPVDLEKVRVRPKRTTKSKKAESGETEGDAAVAIEEAAPSVKPARVKPAAKTEEIAPSAEPKAPAVPILEPASPAAPAPPVAAEAPQEKPPAAEQPAVAAEAPSTTNAVPGKPQPQKAVAGPQNVPMPAKLSGPRIVRIDKPDVIAPPRPALRSPRMGPRPGGPPMMRGPGAPPTNEARPGQPRHVRGKMEAEPTIDEIAEKKVPKRGGIKDHSDEVNEKLREWRDRDLIERRDRLAHASGRGIGGLRADEKAPTRRGGGSQRSTPMARKTAATVSEPIYIKDLSREAGIPVSDLVKKLMNDFGELATINSVIDTERAQLIAAEFGIELTVVKAKTGLERLIEEYSELKRTKLAPRPPVVTVLGHVDHGKTSLLDRIRSANVAAGEAGGITQHIGAYRVKVGDRWVTFLDTPGHTAFTAMRARGTNMTDVVVLVVAADDGVMPTTIEAINHAKAAGTPIVVALNKIDLPHDLNKIYGQLAAEGLSPSEWGGETDVIKTSAISGEGIDDLLSHLATLSEVLDLKADPTLPASGTVIEAQRTEGAGNVARVLVQEGTLKAGDLVVCGSGHGRVRALKDDRGKTIKQAGPSTPVEVMGLSDVPQAGDRLLVVDSAQRAKEIAEETGRLRREAALIRSAKPTNLEAMLAKASEGQIPELRVIIRADVQGSVDVLKKTLSEFPADQVKLTILHAGVGAVTESDVVLAEASNAIIIGFHVVPDAAVTRLAESSGVDIRTYRIIYNVIDDIRKALEGLLTPDEKIESRGRAEVREVFNITRVGRIAGCFVRDGVIQRSHKVRVLRDGVIVKDMGNLDSLKRFKDDVKEVKAGFECGIRVENFDDVKPGDVIEALEVTKVARTL